MRVCVCVTAAVTTAATTTNTAAVRGWARVQRGGMGGAKSLGLTGVSAKQCFVYFSTFSFNKLIHKLSTEAAT